MRKCPFFVISSFLFLSFLLFSALVHLKVFNPSDLDITLWLQAHISRQFDTFFSIFSILGTFEVSSLLLICLISFLFLSKKKLGAVVAIFSYGVILSFELIGKLFIRHKSPPDSFGRYKHFFNFPTDALPHPSYSYPSGHSSRTLFLSTILLLLLLKNKHLSTQNKLLCILIICIYDLFMLISRVYLAEHWTSDVIGGILLGIALGLMTIQFIQVKKTNRK